MNKISCEVIRDLLPLYEDGAASKESQAMVREHLKGCRACRDELDKMRMPISLTPNGDEEAVKRFLERRAEIRRKQNIKIACVMSALAALLVFCLCYALIPRSWDSVSHGVEPDQIMGSHFVLVIQSGDIHDEVWQINGGQATGGAVLHAFMDALQAGSYRAELRNVMNYTPLAPLAQDNRVEGSMGTMILYLVQENEVVTTAMFYGDYKHTVHIWTEGNPNTFYYHTDGAVYDTLTSLMQEYGEIS